MTTDTDSRVAEAMRLHKVSTRSHHVWQTLRALGEQDERAQAAVDDHTALMTYLAAEFDKVPCIASDPLCPCNDGDACNYVATNSTPAFEVPHPDAIQLISIADLMPTLSGADPAMLTNVGHYLRGLSDRVKALPVARTGPLRVADEAESGAVEAVPQWLREAARISAEFLQRKDEPDACMKAGVNALKLVSSMVKTFESSPATLTQAEHEVMSRALRKSVTVVRPSADQMVTECMDRVDRFAEAAAHLSNYSTMPKALADNRGGELHIARTLVESHASSMSADVARLTAELQEVRKDAVPEIDVNAAIAECYRQLKAPQGTKACVAFYRGAEWFREGLLSAAPEATNGRPE
jgi:hypothetical protein